VTDPSVTTFHCFSAFSIVHVFYNIVTFLCITFDALQMHLIVTDVVVTLTL